MLPFCYPSRRAANLSRYTSRPRPFAGFRSARTSGSTPRMYVCGYMPRWIYHGISARSWNNMARHARAQRPIVHMQFASFRMYCDHEIHEKHRHTDRRTDMQIDKQTDRRASENLSSGSAATTCPCTTCPMPCPLTSGGPTEKIPSGAPGKRAQTVSPWGKPLRPRPKCSGSHRSRYYSRGSAQEAGRDQHLFERGDPLN